MRSVTRFLIVFIAAIGSLGLIGCEGTSVSASKMVEVPEGTSLVVRLDQGISSEKNQPGDTFKAHLNRQLVQEGEVVAPVGSEVMGKLTEVKESERVEGRAEMTLTLKQLTVDGKSYDLDTRPITIRAAATKKKDAETIAGGAALGAIIGAIAGGGKGAAIGAGAGAGAGTGVVLFTKGKEVEFGPEARFEFALKEPLELPAYTQ